MRPGQWFPNPHRAGPPGSPAPREVRAFHERLPGYAPTPLHRLDGLARELGLASLHLKDESYRLGLGAFKVMGASWAIHRAREAGFDSRTLSTATAGNHGRAVAWTARTLGLDAVIYIPAGADPVRVAAIRGEGARVVEVGGSYDEAVERCAADSASRGWQVISDTGYPGYLEIPAWVSQGYTTIAREVDDQLIRAGDLPPNMVVVQGGVGSFAAGIAGHYAQVEPRPRIVIVEPAEADCLMASARTADGSPAESEGSGRTSMSGLNCARVSLAAWPTVRAAVDGFLTVTDDEVQAAAARLAHPGPGNPIIEAGPSGAAGAAGLIALARLGLAGGARVLVFNTEGPGGQPPGAPGAGTRSA